MDPFQVWLPAMATHTKSIAGGHWWAIAKPITAHDLKSVYTGKVKVLSSMENAHIMLDMAEKCSNFAKN